MWCVNYIIKSLSHNKKINVKMFEGKKTKTETLTKHVSLKNHLVKANFRILKGLKE